jgi:hypothetical protein
MKASPMPVITASTLFLGLVEPNYLYLIFVSCEGVEGIDKYE